jgi:hypothetical protein
MLNDKTPGGLNRIAGIAEKISGPLQNFAAQKIVCRSSKMQHLLKRI